METSKCPKCGAELRQPANNSWNGYACGTFVSAITGRLDRTSRCYEAEIARLQSQLAAETARADEETKLRHKAFDAHAKLEANWREAERWREEAFICLTHCEAVGADKAAAMFRTLLSRMGIEEPTCPT